MATSATPGRSSRAMTSPTTEMSGCPGTVRSGSTRIRPARSVRAPVRAARTPASGGGAAPAAPSTVPGARGGGGDGRARPPGAPERVPGGEAVGGPRAVLHGQPVAAPPRAPAAGVDLHAEVF